MKTQTGLFKRFLAMVLCLAIISVSLVLIPGADTVPVTDIATESDLCNITNDLAGNYRLVNDITLTENWTPISIFTGTLDGNGFAIRNLNIVDAANVNWGTAGLFGQTNGAVIKNLTLYGSLTNNISGCAVELSAFVGNAKNTQLLNCTSYVNISTGSASARVWAGGICGLAESGTVFQNCVNYGSIQILNQTVAAYCYIGGICGQANNSTTFDGCINNGAITAYPGGGNYAYVGGILGFAEYKATGDTTLLTDCANHAPIAATGVAGGILAFTKQYELIFRGCSNTADITCTTISAGILATAQTGTTYKDIVIENCAVYSLTEEPITILSSEAGSHSGGILAYLNARNVGFSITGCVNTANIVSNGLYAGGIVARANNAATKNITIGHCANTGDVTANGAGEVFIGGIVGRTQTTGGSVSHCYNGGEITAPNKTGGYVGGIAGSEGKLAYDYDFTATGSIFGYGNAAISQEGSKVLETEDDLVEVAALLNTESNVLVRVQDHAFVAVTPAMIPVLKGYQTTDRATADTYAIRLVSVIDRIDCDGLGYVVTVSYTDENGVLRTGSQTIECKYVYTSITESHGKDYISAEELDGAYIFALHIEGAPAGCAVTYTVQPYVNFGNQMISYGAESTFTVSR